MLQCFVIFCVVEEGGRNPGGLVRGDRKRGVRMKSRDRFEVLLSLGGRRQREKKGEKEG